jgi:sugar phosphate isomerase/epimerase
MIGLACSTVSCDGFVDNRFRTTFATLPKIGYKYVEFNCWHPVDLTPRNIGNLKQRCQDSGIRPIAVYGTSFGGNNNHELSKDVAHKIRMIEAATELGCGRIVATGTARGQSGGLEAIISVLREVVPFAEAQGIFVCLENHANNNLENIEDYEAIFSAIDSDNLGLCIDTGHFDAANVSLDDVIDRLAHKVNHIHVKEAAQMGVAKFVRFGEGITNNHRVIERMLDFGYNGYISVELAIEDKSNLIRDLSVPYKEFQRYERP